MVNSSELTSKGNKIPTHPRNITAGGRKTVTINKPVPFRSKNNTNEDEVKPTRKVSFLIKRTLKNIQHRKNCIYNRVSITDINGENRPVNVGSSVVCRHGKLMHAYHSTLLGYDCWVETDPILNPVRYVMNRGKLKGKERK